MCVCCFCSAPTALAAFECAGFCLVGLRTAVPTGDALIALRWHAEANNTDVIAQLCEAARAQLPAGVALSITASQEDALEQMRAHLCSLDDGASNGRSRARARAW